MPGYLGAATLVLMVGMVLTRAAIMRAKGAQAMHFGKIDKTDFLIPPFALFYLYVVFAAAFGWPSPGAQRFFVSGPAAWVGVAFCAAGLGLLLASLVSFGRSFRVGIDTERPDQLVTTGVFAFSRNPIYLAFAAILLGEFLILPSWFLLGYMGAGVWLFHRQVLREEAFLKTHYGRDYEAYCGRVRRYF